MGKPTALISFYGIKTWIYVNEWEQIGKYCVKI